MFGLLVLVGSEIPVCISISTAFLTLSHDLNAYIQETKYTFCSEIVPVIYGLPFAKKVSLSSYQVTVPPDEQLAVSVAVVPIQTV